MSQQEDDLRENQTGSKKFNLIYNKLLRIKITDGKITQSSTLYLYPLENQIDWMLNYDTFHRLPLVE